MQQEGRCSLSVIEWPGITGGMMDASAEMRPMAKKMGRPKTSERDDGTARIDRGILAKAQMITSARKVTMAEYLSGVLQGPVDRDFLKEMRRLAGDEAKPEA